MRRIIEYMTLAFIIVPSLCGCHTSQDEADIFLDDNGSIDYSRWDGWSIGARSSGYYLVQFAEEDVVEQLIFWGSPIKIRLCIPDRPSDAFSLRELVSNDDWNQYYHHIKYQDLYDMIQLVTHYSLSRVSVDNPIIRIEGYNYRVFQQEDGIWHKEQKERE